MQALYWLNIQNICTHCVLIDISKCGDMKVYNSPYLYGCKESLNIWYTLVLKVADLGAIALIKEQATLWIYVEFRS